MKIRSFEPQDAEECENILIDAFGWYFKLKGSSWLKKRLKKTELKNSAAEGITLVAEDEGRIVGYIHASLAAYGVAYISTVGISSLSQGKGVGKLLLKELEETCKKARVRKIWLMVGHINHDAVLFYLKNGYLMEGVMKDMTLNGLHSIIMSKQIISGS